MEPDLREVLDRYRQAVSLGNGTPGYGTSAAVSEIKNIVGKWAAVARENADHNDLLSHQLGVAIGYGEALQDCQRWAAAREKLADRVYRDNVCEYYESKQVHDEPSGEPF
jgi:hypothetical protein